MLETHEWEGISIMHSPTGSREICSPPVLDTDEDYIVLATEGYEVWMLKNGYSQDGFPQFYTGNDAGGFRSFRKGNINLIVTTSFDFFDLFCTATQLAKRFNLMAKADRIALFQAVLYGVKAHNLEPRDADLEAA